MLAVVAIAAGCNRDQDAGRRSDTSVTAPSGGVSGSAPIPSPLPPDTSHAVSPRNCGITGKPVLTEKGIGELTEGRPVAQIRELCDVISDTRERGVEGMMEHVLVTRIAGEPVRSSITDSRIWRIEITSPRFRTSDSLGVDTPLRRIARKRGAQFFPGEGGVYGFVPDHCGLSFRFSVPLRPPRAGVWTAESIDKAHGDAAVDRVLVTRCDPHGI